MSECLFSILRFAAAIIVVLFHQQPRFKFLSYLPEILLAGPQMVTFFFVLSGFVLVIAYDRNERINYKEFLIRRMVKIYPLYFVSLLLPVSVLVVEQNLDFLNLIVNIFLLQSWFPPFPLTINSPAWYLSGIMFCYITFPVILRINKKYVSSSILFVMSLLTWFLTQSILTLLLNSKFYQGFPSVSHDLIFYFPLSHYCSFLMGVSGALLIKDKSNPENSIFHGIELKGMIFMLILIGVAVQSQDCIDEVLGIKLPYASSLYAPFFLVLIFSVFFMGDNRTVNGVFLHFATLIGAMSYPVYILQMSVGSLVFFILNMYPTNEYLVLAIYLMFLLVTGAAYVKSADKPLRKMRYFFLSIWSIPTAPKNPPPRVTRQF